MHCTQISMASHGPLQFMQGAPVGFNGPYLPGANIISSNNNFGMIVIQEFHAEHYTFRYTFTKFFKKSIIKGIAVGEGLFFRVMQKNKLTHRIEEAGKIILKENEYALIKATKLAGTIVFLANKEYESFDCWISPTLIGELVSPFPLLQKLLINDYAEKSILLTKKNIKIDKKTNKMIHEIMECPFTDDRLRVYFSFQVCKLIESILENTHIQKPEKSISEKHKQAARYANELIKTNEGAAYTTIELSLMVQLNECDLKRVYKQLYGVSLLESHQEIRLQLARDLVVETDKPIKEIAGIVGYKFTSNFYNAFTTRFGETPSQYRKNYSNKFLL